MIACQNAQAPGVQRHTFVQSELETEIRDEISARVEMAAQRSRHTFCVIRIVDRYDTGVGFEEAGILRGRVEPRLRDATQEQREVPTARVVQLAVEVSKELAQVAVPAVDQIARELGQSRQIRWNAGSDFERESGAGHKRSRQIHQLDVTGRSHETRSDTTLRQSTH